MWQPEEATLGSSDAKPELIRLIQSRGFELHEEFDVYGSDRTRVRIGFPQSSKQNQKRYSNYDITPSMTVIEMVYMEEAKRLGLDYFSRKELPLVEVWDMFEAVIKVDSESYSSISSYKEKAGEGSKINVPFEHEIRFSMLKKHSRKLDERVDEFPVNKEDINTVGFCRLVMKNENCFLMSTIDYAENLMDKIEDRVEAAQEMGWMYCDNLGQRLRTAYENGDVYEDNFEMYLNDLKNKSGKTHERLMEGFEDG